MVKWIQTATFQHDYLVLDNNFVIVVVRHTSVIRYGKYQSENFNKTELNIMEWGVYTKFY